MEKKKIVNLLPVLLMIVGVMLLSAFTVSADEPVTYSGGTGTKTDPYIISSLADLNALGTSVNGGIESAGKYYIQTGNITGFSKPIGNASHPFKGHYDGGEFSVSFSVPFTSSDDIALFGMIGQAGSVENVVTTGSVMGYRKNLAGVCLENHGMINYCFNKTSLTGSDVVGGLCCTNYGTIMNCANCTRLSGTTGAGGLCYTNKSGGTIINGYNDTIDIAAVQIDGGICGINESGGVIANCYSRSDVTCSKTAGGVCGKNSGTISYAYYDENKFKGKTAIGVDDGSQTNVAGMSTEQMQAPPRTPGSSTWVEIDGNIKPLVDLLNDYAKTKTDLLKWYVRRNAYPTFIKGPDIDWIAGVSDDNGLTWEYYECLEDALNVANFPALAGKPQIVEMLKDDPTIDADKYLDVAPGVTLNLCGKAVTVKGLHVAGKLIDCYTDANTVGIYAEGKIITAPEAGLVNAKKLDGAAVGEDAIPIRSALASEPSTYRIYPMNLKVFEKFVPADLQPVTDIWGNTIYRVPAGGTRCLMFGQVGLDAVSAPYATDIFGGIDVKLGCRSIMEVYPINENGEVTDITKTARTLTQDWVFSDKIIENIIADPSLYATLQWKNQDTVRACTYERYIRSAPCSYEYYK